MSEELRICPIHNIEMTRARATWWEDALQGEYGKGVITSEGNRVTHLWFCKECMKRPPRQGAKEDLKQD